jgi:cytosine/adenosine deaminase-related metal-dependent hydrolase
VRTVLRDIGWLYTCDGTRAFLRNAWVLIEQGVILDIGGDGRPAPQAGESISLRGCLATPGFVNLHHHFFQSISRAVAGVQKSSVLRWLLTLYPVWSELTARDLAAATRVAAAELLLSGCTTSADHSYLVPEGDDEILEAELAAARDMGLRLHLVVGAAPTLEGDLERRLEPIIGRAVERLVYREEDILQQRERFGRRCHHTSGGAMTRIAFGPTGVTYEKPEFMRRVSALSAELGCGLHTHLHPRPDERQKAREFLGSEPVKFLADSGWLRRGAWFAHCSQLRDDEMQIFAERQVGIAHCPRTIPRLGFPLTRISAMRKHGVSVGIGVDGSASNDSGAMIGDMRLAMILHRIGTPPDTDTEREWLEPADLLDMATRTGAEILGRDDIGVIAKGRRADITAFSMNRVDYAGGVTDPLGNLLMAGCLSRAAFTMVEGRVVVRDGKLTEYDEDRIVEEANESSRRMFAKAGMGGAIVV